MSKMMKADSAYREWLLSVAGRFRQSQIKAAMKVNDEMLRFYWTLGRDISCMHGVYTDKTLSCVSEEVFKHSKTALPNDIVMAVTSENVDDVCKCTAWIGDEPVAISGHTAIIHHNQNPKFLSYFFHSESFYKQKVKLAHGTKVIEKYYQ